MENLENIIINGVFRKNKKDKKYDSLIWKTSVEEMKILVSESENLTDLLCKIGLNAKGRNPKQLKERCVKDNIDFSKLLVRKPSKVKNYQNAGVSLAELFKENSPVTRTTIKRFCINYNLIPLNCSICSLKDEWNNKKLVLILDHINGISNDHRIENLRFLCPNCNSQSETFAGKNKTYQIQKSVILINEEKSNQSHPLIARRKIKIRPSKEEILEALKTTTKIEYAKRFGVSSSCIIKWLKSPYEK